VQFHEGKGFSKVRASPAPDELFAATIQQIFQVLYFPMWQAALHRPAAKYSARLAGATQTTIKSIQTK
jgi:hypothetical protein